MTKGIYERTQEMCAAISAGKLGIPISPHTPSHRVAISAAREDSELAKASYEAMRGGQDIVYHHTLYDHADLSKNRVPMTRSNHTMGHHVIRKLGIEIQHINVKEII